jgi:hypothetical protein
MPIPSEIQTIIARLNQEIGETEQESSAGLNLARQLIQQFPENALLIQYFAYFNNILFFVETSRREIQIISETISTDYVSLEVIQEAGEDLGTLVGKLLEVKINASRTKTRLENWL